MNHLDPLKLYSNILSKAKELGASLVGIANIKALKTAPSYLTAPMLPFYNGVGINKDKLEELNYGEVKWPEGAKSVVVIAYAHPAEKPELDYWYGSKDPVGNKKLIEIVKGLIDWIVQEYGIGTFHLPYHVERGGIFLKDAAVVAGMGCIGKNNLLVTPEYGSRVRLRGLTLDIELPSTGPTAFNPCVYCDERCRKSCPQGSFNQQIYSPLEYGRAELPGREGVYDRTLCNLQMEIDEDTAVEQQVGALNEPVKVIKYCRNCELSCPIGNRA